MAELSYEAARDELVGIVHRLETGQLSLEESIRQWERGEALASHCAAWLDGAQQRLRPVTNQATPAAAPSAAPVDTVDTVDTPDTADTAAPSPDEPPGTTSNAN